MSEAQIAEIYNILGEHKRREEALTKMVHAQAEEIEKLKKIIEEVTTW